jgi:hypothetical protein
MPTTQDDTLRRLLAAWDDADDLAALAELDARPPDPPPRTREERAAERAAREDWQRDMDRLGRSPERGA